MKIHRDGSKIFIDWAPGPAARERAMSDCPHGLPLHQHCPECLPLEGVPADQVLVPRDPKLNSKMSVATRPHVGPPENRTYRQGTCGKCGLPIFGPDDVGKSQCDVCLPCR